MTAITPVTAKDHPSWLEASLPNPWAPLKLEVVVLAVLEDAVPDPPGVAIGVEGS